MFSKYILWSQKRKEPCIRNFPNDRYAEERVQFRTNVKIFGIAKLCGQRNENTVVRSERGDIVQERTYNDTLSL